MPKSIYLTDKAYQQIVEAAIQCGFRVSRGRGSQLALFVVMAANNACTGQVVRPAKKGEQSPEVDPVKLVGSPTCQ